MCLLYKLSQAVLQSHHIILYHETVDAHRKCILEWQVDYDDDGSIEPLHYSTEWENQAWHFNLPFLPGKITNNLSITQQVPKVDTDTQYFESSASQNIIIILSNNDVALIKYCAVYVCACVYLWSYLNISSLSCVFFNCLNQIIFLVMLAM